MIDIQTLFTSTLSEDEMLTTIDETTINGMIDISNGRLIIDFQRGVKKTISEGQAPRGNQWSYYKRPHLTWATGNGGYLLTKCLLPWNRFHRLKRQVHWITTACSPGRYAQLVNDNDYNISFTRQQYFPLVACSGESHFCIRHFFNTSCPISSQWYFQNHFHSEKIR